MSQGGTYMRVSIPLTFVALILAVAMLVGCATTPEDQPTAEVSEPVAPEPERREPEPEPEQQAEAEPSEPEPSGPQAAFVGPGGEKLADGASITLPTGAPPDGRIYLWSSDADALGFVTRDGSIPTAENYWVGDIRVDGSRPISSTVETARIYRLMIVSGEEQSPVTTVRVNWQHQESPRIDQPEFVVGDDPVRGSVSLPVGGRDEPDGRLYIRSSYLGATIYVTNDGSDPSPENYWRTGLSDGFYVFATDEFATTYKAIAVLRDSTSPTASLSVEWTRN